jgi:hypothetical protein
MLRCDRVLSKVAGKMVATIIARILGTTVLALIGLAIPSPAQETPAINHRAIGHDAAGTGLERRSEAEPDTTAPWRYYPLAVGNAWEYRESMTEALIRVDIPRDTVSAQGNRYFQIVRRSVRANGGEYYQTERAWVRFDTLTSSVREWYPGNVDEFIYHWAPCPLNFGMGEEFACWDNDGGRGYVVELRYNLSVSIKHDDVVVGAAKTINTLIGNDFVYAADIGEISSASDSYPLRRLIYARVGGEEYGTPSLQLSADVEGVRGTVGMAVYPNPTRVGVTIPFALAQAADVSVSVYDVLGRRSALVVHGERPAGRHAAHLDASTLAAGVYLIRLVVTTGDGPPMVFTQRLTVTR